MMSDGDKDVVIQGYQVGYDNEGEKGDGCGGEVEVFDFLVYGGILFDGECLQLCKYYVYDNGFCLNWYQFCYGFGFFYLCYCVQFLFVFILFMIFFIGVYNGCFIEKFGVN